VRPREYQVVSITFKGCSESFQHHHPDVLVHRSPSSGFTLTSDCMRELRDRSGFLGLLEPQ
jgi:hypothetical protein